MSSGFNSSGNGFLGGGGDGSGPPTGIPISSLTGAEESNSIDNGSFVQQWFWNQLSGLGLSLESVSTNAGGAGQVLFSAGLSGANASANRETKAASLRNAHTGTNSTNIAALFEATDGTTNIAGDFMATGLGTNIAIRVQAGSVDLGSQGSQAGIINFIGLNSGRVGVQPADDGNDWDFVLPQNAGTSGYFLQTDGAGITSWQPASGTPPLTSTYVGFGSDSDLLTGSSDLTWDGTEFNVNGNIEASGTITPSDKRWKENFGEIENAIGIIEKLNPLTYEYKTDANRKFNPGLQYGLIAQEVEQIIPEIVTTDQKGFKGIQYTELIPILIKAVQDQQKTISIQQRQIDHLLKLQ